MSFGPTTVIAIYEDRDGVLLPNVSTNLCAEQRSFHGRCCAYSKIVRLPLFCTTKSSTKQTSRADYNCNKRVKTFRNKSSELIKSQVFGSSHFSPIINSSRKRPLRFNSETRKNHLHQQADKSNEINLSRASVNRAECFCIFLETFVRLIFFA